MEKESIKFTSKEIDYEVAKNAYAWISFDPEKRAKSEVAGFREEMENLFNEVKSMITQENWDSIADKCHAKYTDYLHSKSNTASTMITGGSGFDVARNRKKLDACDNKQNDYYSFKERVVKSIKRQYKKSIALPPLDQAKKTLAAALILHDNMKTANTEWRKICKHDNNTQSQAIKIMDFCKSEGYSEQFMKTIRYNISRTYGQKRPFPSYSLTNSNARIKNYKRNLEKLESREEKGNSTVEVCEGFSMVTNYDADRYQLIFDDKPSDELRSLLKSIGLRWSPRYSAWQRKITANGRHAIQNNREKIKELWQK